MRIHLWRVGVPPNLPQPIDAALAEHAQRRAEDVQNRISDGITRFAGRRAERAAPPARDADGEETQLTRAEEATMCRWVGWSGQPVLIEELLFKLKHGLVDQSLHSRMGVETTNGDGFGLGWYGAGEAPGVYRSIAPAWGDANLRELAAQIKSPLFLAHVRATTGTAIQQTNCHPFRHGGWLFVHNGVIAGFDLMRRELMLAVDLELFAGIEGSTDSEVLFNLALTFGLEDDPVNALERAIGLVEATAVRHGIENAVQASIGLTDGTQLWGFRYSTEGRSRTLFVSADAHAVQQLHPENERIQRLHDEDRVIVSEPLVDLDGLWTEIPESTVVIVQPGPDEQRPFRPHYEEAKSNGAPGRPALTS